MVANILDTPGVYFTEIDQSQYTSDAATCILGLVGTASKGPVNTLTYIATYSQLTTVFGIPGEQYPALIAAREYFASGGTQLWFVRVTDYTDEAATTSIPNIGGSTSVYTAITTGSFFNQLAISVSYGNPVQLTLSASLVLSHTASQTATFTISNVPLQPGTLQMKFGGTLAATDDGAGNLIFTAGFSSTYSAGTINYNTGVVSMTTTAGASAAVTVTVTGNISYYSTFNIQSRFTNLGPSEQSLGVYNMETFTGLTLANVVSTLATSNYISLETAPASFPVAGLYSLSGGTDGTEAIEDVDYIGNTISSSPTGLQLFADPDSLLLDIVMVPGISSSAVRQALVQLAANQRQDIVVLLDPPADVDMQGALNWASGTGAFADYGVLNTTYAAIYFPWFTMTNDITGAIDLVPPSVAGLVACTNGYYYNAPAGPNRGLMPNGFLDVAYVLAPGDRELMGQSSPPINPLANFSGLGVQVLGQYTATSTDSSLNRLVARRVLLVIERNIVKNCRTLLFQPDNPTTWLQMELLNNPYLKSLVDLGIIYSGNFECDATTNTAQIVQNNQVYALVQLYLENTAEQIIIGFQLDAVTTTILENLGAPSV